MLTSLRTVLPHCLPSNARVHAHCPTRLRCTIIPRVFQRVSHTLFNSDDTQVIRKISGQLHQGRGCGAIPKPIHCAQAVRHGACDKRVSRIACGVHTTASARLDANLLRQPSKHARCVLPLSSSAWEAAARPVLYLPAPVDSSSSFTSTVAAFTIAA